MVFGLPNQGKVKNMRYKGPKNKLARREKTDLSLKTAGSKSQSNLLKRINIIPGEQGTRRSRKLTDYGIQLREKQKLKRVYGLTEKQMKNYFIKASRVKGNTTEVMLEFLEKRLDNVLYRLCFSPTRASARQLVNHGHILVNNKKVSIPSFQVSVSDVVSTKDKTLNIPYISASIQKSDAIIPDWLERKGPIGKVVGKPKTDLEGNIVNMQSVIEFYSR